MGDYMSYTLFQLVVVMQNVSPLLPVLPIFGGCGGQDKLDMWIFM